jgi:hypothetical protein
MNAGKHTETPKDWKFIEELTEKLSEAVSDLNSEITRFQRNGNAPPPVLRNAGVHPSSSSALESVRHAKTLASIDWDAAMTAVGEDHEFLVDVLSDFVSAASAGMSALSAAMLGTHTHCTSHSPFLIKIYCIN